MSSLSKCRVLLVDDSPANLDVLVETLKDEHILSVATDGPLAITLTRKVRPDIILLDVMMPSMDGFQVCEVLRGDEQTRDIPIIFLTALEQPESKVRAFDTGAVDYITKPFHPAEVRSRLRTHLSLVMARRELAKQNDILDRRVRERTRELDINQKETIIRLSLAAEHRDTDTGAHIRRIQEYCVILARQCGLPEQEAQDIALASTMHDLGKIGIPDAILNKPGPLTREEWVVMRKHPLIGATILENSRSRLINLSRSIALRHHEHFNGRGYPHGLVGEAIPLAGRIVGLVDVLDALTSKRPYKPAWEFDRAVAAIAAERGSHFDPQLVDMFMASLGKMQAVHAKWSATVGPSLGDMLEYLTARFQEEADDI
jgi:putative two-component system response regulator